MELVANVEKKVSRKTGKEYVCIIINFPHGYQKVVFPKDSAESFIFNQLV